MARIRLFPHRTADPSSVTFGEWWIEREGARATLPEMLDAWDYASSETVGLTLTVDEELFGRSTGLRGLDDVELLLVGDCRDSQIRVVSRHILKEKSPVNEAAFALALPSGVLAGSLALTAILSLAHDLEQKDQRIAYQRGARLMSSKTTTIALEGEASRFPTEPAAFSHLGLPNAPWTLRTTYDGLNSSFMGGVRLLVNTEHAVGRMLLERATAGRVSGMAMADVIRLLVATVSEDTDEMEFGGGEEGSVGFVIENMCNFYLGRGIAEAIKLYQTDALQFDRLLHDRVQPFAKAFA